MHGRGPDRVVGRVYAGTLLAVVQNSGFMVRVVRLMILFAQQLAGHQIRAHCRRNLEAAQNLLVLLAMGHQVSSCARRRPINGGIRVHAVAVVT